MKINKDSNIIEGVLTRGVEQILPGKDGLKKRMLAGKIRFYWGIDPTSPKMHLGHANILRKIRQFQNLGHETVLLFGTFTAQIGDPSGKDERRKVLTFGQVKKNMATYRKQAFKIIDAGKTAVEYNHKWLAKLDFQELARMTSYFTVSRLLERDMFQERMHQKKEIWLNELLYPLMQGYDSVALDVDMEIGATDQTFNMMVGRKLQAIYRNREKYIMTLPILPGLDGRKMSKSFGNTVNLDDTADETYGKLMSLKDDLIIPYFKICTDLAPGEIKKMEEDLKEKKINPKKLKEKLAREITAMYHGGESAEKAEKEFNRVFKEKQSPAQIPEIKITESGMRLPNLLSASGIAHSLSEAERLIKQKAVEIDGQLKIDRKEIIKIRKGMVIKRGKRTFVKIK